MPVEPSDKESEIEDEELVDKKPILQEIHKCFKCDKELTTLLLLKMHYKRVHKSRMEVKCDICGKILARPDRLKKHMEQHKKIREKPAKCKDCDNSFYTNLLLDLHIERMHTKSETELLCPNCGSIFWNEWKYKKHLKEHEILRNEKISCIICKKSFKKKAYLTIHMDRHKKEKKFQCQDCDKIYSSTNALRLHKQMHHSSVQYPCEETGCGKSFKRKGTLEEHLSSHKGVIKKCQFCTKSYTIKASLDLHIKLKHPDKIEKEFKCTFEGCKVSLASHLNLERHLKKHEDPERKFMCEECGYCAKTMDHLKNHLGKHKSERNFKCDVEGCKKDFKYSSNLLEHKKFYHDMTPQERREYFKKQRELKKRMKGPQKEAPDSGSSEMEEELDSD